MSPSEFDLRSALRDGEGDGVDVDQVVALGSARRAERRSRILTTAAAVVVVGALGTGGAFAFRGGSSSDSGGAKSGANAAAGQVSRDAVASSSGGALNAPGARASSAPNAAPGASAGLAVTCPVQYPRTLLPTGPATTAPLFARPVSFAVVCSYGAPSAVTPPVRLVLDGARAADLVGRLEHASTKLNPVPCPSVRASQQTALAIIGVAADGRTLPVVTTTVDSAACNLQATNGIAVRWNWKPPADLLHELADLTPAPTGRATLTSPSSGIRASPVR